MIEARFRLDRALQRGLQSSQGSDPGFRLEVDLKLPGRGVSALFGPSGCGKTTLLRCLAGLEPAAHGRLVIDGQTWHDDVEQWPPHRRAVGLVFQEASLFEHLDVRGNIAFGWRRVPAADRRISVQQAAEWLDLGPLLGRRVTGLSGGERQRVAIARALAASPRLLLLDEPLAALDAARKAEILPCLERLHRELALPIVLVSHAADEVARLADHLVLMRDGRVQAEGPATELFARPDLPLPQGEDVGVLLHACIAEVDAHWHLARLQGCDPTPGPTLWTRDPGLPVGHEVRLRVLARDVSVATEAPRASSVQNQLPAVIDAIADDTHPGLVLVRLRVGAAPLLARLTRRAVHALELAPGNAVWALVKSVALLD